MRENKTDKAVKTAVRILAILIIVTMWIRIRDYRAVIYDYQRTADSADTAVRSEAQGRIERRIGRANYPYDRLTRRPRYPHFWDDYNIKTTEKRQTKTLD